MKDVHEKSNLEKILEGGLLEAMRRNTDDNAVIDRRRYAMLERVCDEMIQVLDEGQGAELSLHPASNSGAVSFYLQEIDLDRADAQQLKRILRNCNTFSMVPLTNGKGSVSATVKNIYKER